MPTINDTLTVLLEGITGQTGLTLNDQMARLEDLNYVIPPRTATDPVNPPIGATWTNTTDGKVKQMTAGGTREIDTIPIP